MPETYSCPDCDREFDTDRGRSVHYAHTHGGTLSMVDLICENCGEEFKRTKSDVTEGKDFCQRKCMSEYQSQKVSVECNQCGIEFKRKPSKAGGKTFCSTKCKSIDSRRQVDLTCKVCGDGFSRKKSDVGAGYCSPECGYIAESAEIIELECDNCGIEFERPEYDVQDENNYCSLSCSNSKEGHWNWQGGDSDHIRRTPEYREWNNTIHETRDDCAECQSEENLQAHHIVPVGEDSSLATDVDNGVLLCGRCHSSKHPNLPEGLFLKGDG